MMQSEGAEFGCCDGYEQSSIRKPPPVSPAVMQQLVRLSFVSQSVPVHLLVPWPGPTKGSATPVVSEHVDVHATGTEPLQRSGAPRDRRRRDATAARYDSQARDRFASS